MRLTVNGKAVEIEREMSIAEFLRARNVAEALVAVEHNLEWVRREQWSEVILEENDRLEVVRIMAGGGLGAGCWGLGHGGRTMGRVTRSRLPDPHPPAPKT